MLHRLLEDLRFVIGALFGSIGLILLAVALGDPQPQDTLHLNLTTGAAMTVFAGVMVAMALAALRQPGSEG
jgi:hypothetical protein